jgi:hypothetical protein|tara:strand:- start:13 stop:165 length:153 start_codon:yes stop_codon:yes gene_type:complete
MNKEEEILINLSLKYKKEYEDIAWWKFLERSVAKAVWYSARDMAMKYGTK